MYQEFLSYQDLGKIIHVLSRLSRSCMSWQGVSSFVSLGLPFLLIIHHKISKLFFSTVPYVFLKANAALFTWPFEVL